MKRRDFLGLAAVGAAGLVLPAAARSSRTLPPSAQLHLLTFLHDEQRVRDIGRSYRELVPHEDNAGFLADAILGPQSGPVPAALAVPLDRQVREDFAQGRTVKVNGWIVSVTEARQCALYSLHQS
jgi:hypothetical protein